MSNGYKSNLANGGDSSGISEELDYANKVIIIPNSNGSFSYTTTQRGLLSITACQYRGTTMDFTVAGKRISWGRSDYDGGCALTVPIDSGVYIYGKGYTFSGVFIPYKDQNHRYLDFTNAVSIGKSSTYNVASEGIVYCSFISGDFTYNNTTMPGNSNVYGITLPVTSGDSVNFPNLTTNVNTVPTYFIPYAE